jgi:hypothetical protein
MSDEAQSHSPFLRRLREGGRREERADDPVPVDTTPPDPAGEDPRPEEPSSPRDGLRRALFEVGERVDEIIAGAELAAEDIRRHAEAEADRYRAERRQAEALEAERNRRFQDALEELKSGVARIEGDAESVVRSVEEAIRRTEEEPHEPAAAAAPPPPAAPTPIAYPGRANREPDGEPAAEPRISMLIRATQLAVQGHERAEIEQTLESEFGATGVPQVVDEVLGRRR